MNFFILLIIIFLLLFLPLPIKIKIEYLNNNLELKLYKFTLFSSKNGIENKFLNKFINKNNKDKNNKKARNKNKKKSKQKTSFKKIYSNISNNRFKPKIKIIGSLNYGLDDAALCALLYGILCNLPNIIFFLLSIIFKVKDLKFDINPKFNISLLSFGITSIFYFNIANIIYMLFLLIKSLEIKEVTP